MLPLNTLHLFLVIFLQGIFAFSIDKFYSSPEVNNPIFNFNASVPTSVQRGTTEKSGILYETKSKITLTTEFLSQNSTEKHSNVNLQSIAAENISQISYLPKFVKSNINESIIIINLNETFENNTIGLSNDTFNSDYTMTKESSSSFWTLRPVDTAAIVAGMFLILGVVGYGGCVIYRRYLQRKYGDNQILPHEEFYDTTDLRYFEI